MRAWGTGLGAHESPDVRATGKAILLLIEEIERLHIDLWSAKSTGFESALEPDDADGLAQTLRGRLSRLRRHA